MDFELRFWSKVAIGDGCWEWQAARHRRGYGAFTICTTRSGKLSGYAHRVAWSLVNGALPDGMNVLHRCDNPPCVRPSHLFIGSQKDNVADMIAKGRRAIAPCAGTSNGNAKLTGQHVGEIRAMWPGYSMARIARVYGITPGHVHRIVHGVSWRTTCR